MATFTTFANALRIPNAISFKAALVAAYADRPNLKVQGGEQADSEVCVFDENDNYRLITMRWSTHWKTWQFLDCTVGQGKSRPATLLDFK